MENLVCRSCRKELTKDMEVEYSQTLTEFFCSPDCATSHYYEYMMSSPVDFTDRHFLKDKGIKIVKGKLVITE
jgi:hypothetical protein